MTPLISVIIPVKNGANYLQEAIEGIKNQNMNVEIIVVDDGSTDNTAKIAQNEGCIVIKHDKCKGQVAAKNTGLKAAKGEYIMFHDHDDIMNPESLAKMYQELEKDSSIKAVMCKVKDFISPDSKDNNANIKPEPYYGLFTGAVLIRAEVFNTIGEFNDNINTGEIIEWQSKMTKNHFGIRKLDIVSTNRRVHNSNFGKTHQNKEYKDYASVLRAKLRK